MVAASLEAFLVAAEEVPVVDRVAYFDNDGTLWCERPSYVQLDFFLDALRRRTDRPRRRRARISLHQYGTDVRRDRADHRRRGTPGMDRGEHGP